ncbi:MAG: DUF5995 family protein [Halobacteriales archaeon]
MSDELQGVNGAADRVADLADDLAPYHRRYEDSCDSRAVFAYAYHNLTRDLAEKLADGEGFHEPNWVADLAVAFGTRYMAAMDAIDGWERDHAPDAAPGDAFDEAVPRPWADVYRAICRARSTVLEDLVFAMGAHITYDLPHALLEVGIDAEHLADYHRMNDVLASQTDAVQDAVTDRYNRLVGRLERVAGGFDELFTNYWLRIGRSVAWYNAMRMQSPRSRAAAEGSIERATFYLIESARSSGPWLVRSALRVYRRLLPLARRWPEPPAEGRGARW